MKQLVAISALILILSSLNGFGQRVRETTFGVGINKTIPENFSQHWSNEFSAPTFLNLKVGKNWYRDGRAVAFVKSAGLNLQYSNMNIGGGGLAAGNHYTGKIINLYAEASLQARVRIDSIISFSFGPVAEYLIGGYHNITNSYYTMFTNPPSSGDKRDSGIGPDYFNKPSYGIKMGLASDKAKVGVNLSYYWTKSEHSNFFTSNYLQITVVIGFKKQKPSGLEEIKQ